MHLAIWTDRKTGMASMPCSFDSTHGEARFPGVRIMWKRGGNPALMHARSARDNSNYRAANGRAQMASRPA